MSNRVLHITGWKSFAFIGGFVGIIGAFLYPIIIYPLTHTAEYSEKTTMPICNNKFVNIIPVNFGRKRARKKP